MAINFKGLLDDESKKYKKELLVEKFDKTLFNWQSLVGDEFFNMQTQSEWFKQYLIYSTMIPESIFKNEIIGDFKFTKDDNSRENKSDGQDS